MPSSKTNNPVWSRVAPAIDASRDPRHERAYAVVSALSPSAAAAARTRLANAACVSRSRSRRGVLPGVLGIWTRVVVARFCGPRDFVPRSGFRRGIARRRTGTARLAAAVFSDRLADSAHAGECVSRQSADSFSALCRTHERAAPRTTPLAGMGVLGSCASRSAGFTGRSASRHRRAVDRENFRSAPKSRPSGGSATMEIGAR